MENNLKNEKSQDMIEVLQKETEELQERLKKSTSRIESLEAKLKQMEFRIGDLEDRVAFTNSNYVYTALVLSLIFPVYFGYSYFGVESKTIQYVSIFIIVTLLFMKDHIRASKAIIKKILFKNKGGKNV